MGAEFFLVMACVVLVLIWKVKEFGLAKSELKIDNLQRDLKACRTRIRKLNSLIDQADTRIQVKDETIKTQRARIDDYKVVVNTQEQEIHRLLREIHVKDVKLVPAYYEGDAGDEHEANHIVSKVMSDSVQASAGIFESNKAF